MHRKEFEKVIKASQEIPREIAKHKEHSAQVISQLNEYKVAVAKYKTLTEGLRG